MVSKMQQNILLWYSILNDVCLSINRRKVKVNGQTKQTFIYFCQSPSQKFKPVPPLTEEKNYQFLKLSLQVNEKAQKADNNSV